jgi:hypothetical protein
VAPSAKPAEHFGIKRIQGTKERTKEGMRMAGLE